MGTKDFIVGGMMGDFIHSLFAIKNICERNKIKANVYLVNGCGGDVWRFGIDQAFNDLKDLMKVQPYVNHFGIITKEYLSEAKIYNMNAWRGYAINLYNADGGVYKKCWSELLSDIYVFEIPKEYSWLNVEGVNEITKDKIVIHRSLARHNPNFNWQNVLADYPGHEIVFVTSDLYEWWHFPYKKEGMIPFTAKTMNDMAVAINSAKMFIGNQSSPFAIASALDKKRLVELDSEPAGFYKGETKYSKNISWFLNEKEQWKQ